jgi:hypothetical protein
VSSFKNESPLTDAIKFADKFEDPHVLKSQQEADFSSDTEESIGTFEDYQKRIWLPLSCMQLT